MSISIGWRPVNPNDFNYVEGTSSFREILERAFGSMPITLESDDIGILNGIVCCGYPGAQQLLDAINEKGAIIVEAHY